MNEEEEYTINLYYSTLEFMELRPVILGLSRGIIKNVMKKLKKKFTHTHGMREKWPFISTRAIKLGWEYTSSMSIYILQALEQCTDLCGPMFYWNKIQMPTLKPQSKTICCQLPQKTMACSVKSRSIWKARASRVSQWFRRLLTQTKALQVYFYPNKGANEDNNDKARPYRPFSSLSW